MNETEFDGGCLCGAVRYRAASAPVRGVMCHCSMCRKQSGAPAQAFIHFPARSFTWTKGQPNRYRSSKIAERGFCASCGSILVMYEEGLTERVQVTVGSLDTPERARLNDHVWTEDRLPWFEVKDDLPRYHQYNPDEAADTIPGE